MQGQPQSARFTVEGRIGGRWWVWQRFATHDEAAAEIERMAGEKRFDGARLIETVPSWNGAPSVSRELFVLDPKGPRAADIAAAEAAPPTGPLFVAPLPIFAPEPPAAPPPAARKAPPLAALPIAAAAAAPPQPAMEPPVATPADNTLIAAPVADALANALARVAAAAREAAEMDALAAEAAAAEAAAAEAAPKAAVPPAPSEAPMPAEAEQSSLPENLFAAGYVIEPATPPAPPPEEPSASDQPARDPQADASSPLDDAGALPEVAPTNAPPDDRADRAAVPPAEAPPAEVPSAAASPAPDTVPAGSRSEADRLWSEFIASERTAAPPANDDVALAGRPVANYAIYDDEDRVAAIPRSAQWRFRLRKVAYTLGAGLASLLLCIASYEATRLAIGLPDLLGEAYQAVALLTAGPERPIVAAARRGRQDEVAQLLRGGFSPNSEDPQGVPVLLVAARGGHLDIVHTLLDAGADPNRRFGPNATPLLASAREGLLSSVDAMMQRGGQVNGRGGVDDCDTPLLVAANAGRLEMVNYLLARGATFDVLPGCRRGALDAAAAHPRVRDVLEAAYQRRLAGVPRAIPAAANADLLPSTLPRGFDAAPAAARAPIAPGDDARGYAARMYGFTWRDTLAEVKARAKECRAVGRRYEVCELQVKPLLDDAALVEAWFDRGDGDRFVSIETRSIELVDYTAQRDGATVRQRFDQVRREIERFLPQGQRPILQRLAPASLPFFEALKPEMGAGDFSAFWSDDAHQRPASVHLKLSGIDARKGFYRIVVSNPLRQSQQAAAPQ
ncbi:MAG: ankyrin repeat domain-containing protein [Alphaproteobacteria bacterium]|nr:ankyrin repeat domain-containing protein [Alphaproteobacteria bacterium]